MSMSEVPDAPDESCRHRETVRLPPSTASEIQRLVEEGHYPNRSAAIRAGVRLLIDHESRKAEQSSDADGSGNSTASTGSTQNAPDASTGSTESDSNVSTESITSSPPATPPCENETDRGDVR